jgi:hypothetical protein
MARRTHMTMQKRQRELKRAEKAARKRAKRHGQTLYSPPEPMPTVDMSNLVGNETSVDEETPDRSADTESDRQDKQDKQEES